MEIQQDSRRPITQLQAETRDENQVSRPSEDKRSDDAVWSAQEQDNLARAATDHSLRYPESLHSDDYDDESSIDPTSESFDLRQWMRYQVRQLQDGGNTPQKTGVIFKKLSVYGSGSAIQIQRTVGSIITAPLRPSDFFGTSRKRHKTILRDFSGYVSPSEMLLVLGRPGSGCSTFLKSISADTAGLKIDEAAEIHYNGIPQRTMARHFKGEIVYNSEMEYHFAHLTVGETLGFAAAARTPRSRLGGQTRASYVDHVRNVVMATFGLSHTVDTKVGSEFVRGVSGGERKRVSIAEMALAGSPLCCWDNATRGLDSASSLEFAKALHMSSRIFGSTHLVSLYQASQCIYDLFDKVTVLFEGRQIFFGPSGRAKAYFEEMGWHCPSRQTTGDFLTSLTNPNERRVRSGYEKLVPRTSEEFEKRWRDSADFRALTDEVVREEQKFTAGNETEKMFFQGHRERQSKYSRTRSPYMISVPMQVKICTTRAYQRIWNDKTSSITLIGGQIVMSLIIGSLFYGAPFGTQSFFAKSSTLFFAVMLNSLITVTEVNPLYSKRPIIAKHASYKFYHPFSEALAGVVSDFPIKLVSGVVFNTTLYFLSDLRYEPGPFFVFFLFTFMSVLCMSQIFRTVAAASKTMTQALAVAGVVLLAAVIYTGYVIPRPNMHPWFGWIFWINPLSYAYESLIVNEFHHRNFPCSSVVPPYPGLNEVPYPVFVCDEKGAKAGELFVNGDSYLDVSYRYSFSHLWRNFGVLCGFLVFFLIIYPLTTELNYSTGSKAEALVFRQGHVPKSVLNAIKEPSSDKAAPDRVSGLGEDDSPEQANILPPQHKVFSWKNVCFDIQFRGHQRRLLDNVSGWVKPGTLTALMGVSGAGKTTLLNVLAQRADFGVVTGDILINSVSLDASFQRKIGYVQQQDLHLHTSTVREALRFSALLRQPNSVSTREKYDFVEEGILLHYTENTRIGRDTLTLLSAWQ